MSNQNVLWIREWAQGKRDPTSNKVWAEATPSNKVLK